MIACDIPERTGSNDVVRENSLNRTLSASLPSSSGKRLTWAPSPENSPILSLSRSDSLVINDTDEVDDFELLTQEEFEVDDFETEEGGDPFAQAEDVAVRILTYHLLLWFGE